MLAHDREGVGQLGEGAAELAGVLRAVERAAGRMGDLLERAIVGVERVAAPAAAAEATAKATAKAAELGRAARQRRGIVCAVTDREDANAPGGGRPRRPSLRPT